MYTVHVLGIDGVWCEYHVFASSAGAERSVIGFEAEGFRAKIYRTASRPIPQTDFRRGGGGQADRSDLLAGSRGVRPLEPAPARRESRRTEHRQAGQRQHDRPGAKKTRSNLTAIGNG